MVSDIHDGKWNKATSSATMSPSSTVRTKNEKWANLVKDRCFNFRQVVNSRKVIEMLDFNFNGTGELIF